VALIVKRAVEKAGLDPDKYAGHSLPAGLATSAAQAGVSQRSIMAQTGHRSVVVARRYIRDGSLFRDNAAAPGRAITHKLGKNRLRRWIEEKSEVT